MKKAITIILAVAAVLVIIGAIIQAFADKKAVTIKDVPLNDLKRLKAKHYEEFKEEFPERFLEDEKKDLDDTSQGTE